MLFIYIALLTLAIILLFPYYYKYRKSRKVLAKIPGPPEKYLIGNLDVLMRTDRLFYTIRKYSKKYYPIYKLTTPYVTVVSFLDPKDIELVLSSTKHLTKSKVYTFLHRWLGTGLLTSTGEKWHKRRKILTPAFHFTILQQFLNIFNEETSKLVEKLNEECGKVIDVVPAVTNFTLQSIAETAMGLDNITEKRQKEYKNAIYELGGILLKRLSRPWCVFEPVYNLTSLAKREKALVKILHDFSTSIIKKREQNPSTVTSKKKRLAMLDLLLAAKNNGTDIDNEGIREEVDTFMFEGHDTTTMAISFILLVLANLPEVQNGILEEILAVVGPEDVPTYNQLQQMKYTERYASEDFTTSTGHYIPEGTILHVHIFDVHRNETIYPEPCKFDPDRFLPENVNRRHSFAYIPFSAGPRNCIGQKFALLELKTVLCGILRKFKLEKVDNMDGIVFRADLILRSEGNIRIKILQR